MVTVTSKIQNCFLKKLPLRRMFRSSTTQFPRESVVLIIMNTCHLHRHQHKLGPAPSPVGGHLAACGQRWPVGRPICVAARFTWRGCLQSVVSCGIQGDFGAGTGWDCVAVHFFLGKTNTKNICMFAAFICWSIIFCFMRRNIMDPCRRSTMRSDVHRQEW